MEFSETPEQAAELTATALASIQRHGLKPVPKTISLFYAYHAEGNDELTAAIDSLLKKGEALSDHMVEELFVEYFEVGRGAAAIRETGEKMEKALAGIDQVVASVSKDAEAYGQQLKNLTGKLSDDVSIEDLRGIIGKIRDETEAMREKGKNLKTELDDQILEIGDIKGEMKAVLEDSMVDTLTGVANRRFFIRTLSERAQEAARSETPLSLLMVQVDEFGKFIEAHGRKVGGDVLGLLGKLLSNLIREQDLAAHYGGEQFALILPELDIDQAKGLATRIIASVSNHKLVSRGSGEDYGTITLSAGVCLLANDEATDKLIKRTEAILAKAFRGGGNVVLSQRDGNFG